MIRCLGDVKRYHRIKLLTSLLGTLIFLAYAGLWMVWGGNVLVEFINNRWLGLLAFGLVFGVVYELLTLPLEYYSEFVIEHRFELSNQSLSRWIIQALKGWVVGGLIGGVVLSGMYALLWYAGTAWWIWVWIGWIGLAVVLAQLFPVLLLPLFYKSAPLEDEGLAGKLTKLAEGTSLKLKGIFRLELSRDTKVANAMLTGLGSTRRVYLADTLLEAFPPEELEVVFAHELGHHTRKHIWKMIVIAAVLASIHIAVLAFFLHRFRGASVDTWRSAVMVIPQIAVALTIVSLITAPIHNALSRRFERQCDGDALIRTGRPEAYRSAYNRLADMNLADPEPHRFIEWYFYDHPAMAKRIALADEMSECER